MDFVLPRFDNWGQTVMADFYRSRNDATTLPLRRDDSRENKARRLSQSA